MGCNEVRALVLGLVMNQIAIRDVIPHCHIATSLSLSPSFLAFLLTSAGGRSH